MASILQSVLGTISTSATCTATFTTANLSSGSKLVAFVTEDINTTFYPSTVKLNDTAVSSFARIAQVALPSTTGGLSCWVLDTPADAVGTKPTVTATLSGNFGSVAGVLEVSGIAAGSTAAACIDGTFGANTGTATPATGGTYSDAVAGELLLAVVGDPGNSTTYTLTGFTQVFQTASSSAAELAVGWKNSTGGSETFSWATGATQWGTLLFAFKPSLPAAAGPGQAQPGQTWRRRYKHRQQALTAPGISSATATAGVATVAAVAPGTAFDYATAGVAAVSAVAAQPFFSRYITGVAGTPGAGWFTDQTGAPRPWIAAETWGLPVRAGLNSSGNWQGDYDSFFASRAAQGFTVCMTDPVWCGSGSAYHGKTWDSLTPLTGGTTNPTGATLDSTFWGRIDYMMTSAQKNGITIGFVIYNTGDDHGSGDFYNTWTATQWTNYGALVGARYQNTPNLVWLVGNDDFSPFSDTNLSAVYSGVTGTGDAHLWGAWYNPECTSRWISDTNTAEPWGTSNSAFNFCYSYNEEYWIIEYAYLEVANLGSAHLLPTIQGDGYFYQGTTTYSSTDDRGLRQMWWWALASGARGVCGESEAVYPWTTGAAAAVTTDWFFANNAANIVTAFTGLTGWNLLIPDTGNALVTAGRGTRATGLASGGSGGQYEPAFTNSYVAASLVPGGSLAVLYLPNHTTITIDQTQMASGYTATWVDPISGATSSATTGSTYNSTAKGTNSQGDPDWVLVLQAPTAVTATAGVAAVSVVSVQPAAAVTATAGVATVLAVAPAATAAEAATAGVSTVLAVAPAPTVAETVAAGVAVVLAADPGATVSTSSGTTATAGVAVVSVVATAATAADIAVAGVATVLAVAPAATDAVTVAAGVAVVAAAAPAPAAAETATAGVSTVLAVAPGASTALTAVAGVAVVLAVAPQASVSTSGNTNAVAGVATVLAAAPAPAPALTVPAGAAAAAVAAPASVAAPAAVPGAAVVTATAPAPSLASTAHAQAAAVLAAAVPTAPPFQVARSTASVTATDTSAATVTDPRDGTASVAAAATSSPSVS